MLSAELFCANCGAANQSQDTYCFACHQPLQHTTTTTTTTTPAQTTHLLRQRYQLLERLGQGGMGSVYKAEDIELGNRPVAIKELSQKGLNQQESQEAEESFKHEALLLAGLMHPNLPRIYENFSEAGRWYLVMDFIEGETLEDYLARRGGQLPWSEIYEICIQLCSVLQYLHTRPTPIVFRDLKPLNVMLTPNRQVYLIDFGIARLFKPGQAHDTIAFGSPGYAAPEQYGKAQTRPNADIYSLGAMLHQMLSGIDPATNPFAFSKIPGIPASLQALLDKMLDMNAGQRIAYVEMVQEQLRRINTQNSSLLSPSIQTPAPTIKRPAPTPAPASNRASSRSVIYPPAPLPTPSTPPQAAPVSPVSTPIYIPGASKQPSVIYPPAPAPVSIPQLPVDTSYRGKLICHYQGHMGVVTSIAWSPDSKQIASAGYDKTVQIWDIKDGQLRALYAGNQANKKTRCIEAVVWSPNGKLLACVSNDGIVQVWDSQSLQTKTTYKLHKTGVHALVWSPDGSALASASDDKLSIWNPTNGTTILEREATYRQIQTVSWSSDNSYLAIGYQEPTIEIIRISLKDKLQQLETIYTGNKSGVTSIAWSPDGKYIASGGSDKTVQVWEFATRKHISTYAGHSGAIYALSWSPDSQSIVSSSADGKIQIWDPSNGKTLFTHPSANPTIYALSWSPDGKDIASAAHSSVIVWEAPDTP
ncbi:hypothetical protein KDA_22000 [Dictyobacter alpinus]|uniref:Protein kinase domain-containing protein n=1 Tax=Dictyobacter alpinus TaxID=2014873 RepID=A0A402B5T9_9CHLR|nr:serine/threonine-protein kinase [Dictyobacter alpinus]GCE26716.1 hypothetical protein KDA_22000 [Dictyobacter alpinus]